ncbi:saccharopine dehydrogenase NADP-binding domain-containing protein [Actinokineospora globicatena]|uniref:saccharopine dehydrogenase NADP-binding domain-containing protein n=1 Tax=Actinokineospora globicatena TaxID=103729 RepID=UPI0020A483F3|nr:saccharopine dehydrogenase NADP-binding domain-containing protein [Actinokineospora globicatena]MCP2305993.1 Saccharopine dehydrogenase NADP binding domain-containing protein [Actinokineospora globicatena]GLW80136.1 saccharopine dehydrogenase [Actinokineospora globicatena]GLW86965.1 saccharopine dehydrogenase [Actinokineospora globicatena]
MGDAVVVYGASGHTGRFVVAELSRRGFEPIPAGRRASDFPGLDVRVAAVDDAAGLDRVLAGAAAVINCAGPFAVTAGPVVEAALRASVPYVDIAAEIEANVDTLARFAGMEGVAVPGMAFFGGLGDLLATAAMGDWVRADSVHVAYGLSGWHPTPGTLAAGAVSRDRRGGKRVRFVGGRLEYCSGPLPVEEWDFPQPLGRRAVLGEFTMADVVTIPSHVEVGEVRTYMTTDAAADLAAGSTTRTPETFLVDVIVRSGGESRRLAASGRDIYAVTAPLAAEAVERILTGRLRRTGVASAGALFDAPDFLRALSPHITIHRPTR